MNILSYIHRLVTEENRPKFDICSDDNDVSVLLLFFLWKWQNSDILIRMTKFDGTRIDINKPMQKLGRACEHILAAPALTGCDTVSYPFNKGKVKGLSIIQKQTNLHLNIFGDPRADVNDVVNAGMEFLCLLYGDSVMSMTE